MAKNYTKYWNKLNRWKLKLEDIGNKGPTGLISESFHRIGIPRNSFQHRLLRIKLVNEHPLIMHLRTCTLPSQLIGFTFSCPQLFELIFRKDFSWQSYRNYSLKLILINSSKLWIFVHSISNFRPLSHKTENAAMFHVPQATKILKGTHSYVRLVIIVPDCISLIMHAEAWQPCHAWWQPR